MTISNAEVAEMLGEYMGVQSSLLDQTFAWLSGAPNGGPNGDGIYPITRADGTTVMRACPKKQIADAIGGGGLTQAGFAALGVGVAGDIGETIEILATGTTGAAPKRFSPYLFTQRKTVDRDVLNGGEYAEWIDCLSSTGMERKIAFSDLQKQFGGVIDPTRQPYNVKYDFQKAKPASCTAGSNLITCGTNRFTSADVGKILVISNGMNSTLGPLMGVIGQVVSATQVRLFTDLTFATPANANSTRAGEEMIWGTDNTAGLQAAFDAAEPLTPGFASGSGPIGSVVVIGGMALARVLRFGSIGIVGLADTGCGFASLPVAGAQSAFFGDKTTGAYATNRADGYTLKNLTILGQRFTQYYSSFRNAFEISGGLFGNFPRGAPYARIENLDVFEGQWNGIVTNGAFAGQFNNVRALFNAQCGMRMGFWDLNGTNWHAEANGGAGVFSIMPGANVTTVRASFNGAGAGQISLGGSYYPHEYGSNWTEAGYGNTISNLRMQESWSHSLCFSGKDPLNVSNGRGNKNAFFIGTLDDTADIQPGQRSDQAAFAVRVPGVRAMIYIKGNTAVDNTVAQMTASPQVLTTNYATNGYWDEGNPVNNEVTLRTPGITNDPASWYAGLAAHTAPNGQVIGSTLATARGAWGTSSSSSIAARGNQVVINGATAL